ncbi:MAG TPA: arylesterase [Patescibacteria group bacterium]|nr:arylesterase [Patescibacteria group bacterium]
MKTSFRKRYLALFFLSVSLLADCKKSEKQATETTGPTIETEAPVRPSGSQNQTSKNILFLGNSITAGFGLELSQAFPALIQKRMDSLKLPFKSINAGVSGETSAGGLRRIDWLLKDTVHVMVLELGANDGLRGMPVADTRKNLQAIIDRTREKYPAAKIILAGMQLPPNMGQKYTTDFKNMYIELAQKNNIALIPFILEGVGGVPRLNLADGIHPTAEGHRILADNVWKVLRPQLDF